MNTEKRPISKYVKYVSTTFFIVGILFVFLTPIFYILCQSEIPSRKLSPSTANMNYELNLQPNVSFVISFVAHIPGDSDHGDLSLYINDDFKSDSFDHEIVKIDFVSITSFTRDHCLIFMNDSNNFNDFFYNNINYDIPYIPNYQYYPVISIRYNGSLHNFFPDNPLQMPEKILLNEDEIDKAKEKNSFISNLAFQLLGIGFSCIFVSNVVIQIYLNIRKMDWNY